LIYSFKDCNFIDFKEFEGCSLCKGKGYIYEDIQGVPYAKKCKCLTIWQELKRTVRELHNSNAPKEFWNYHITKDYRPNPKITLKDIYTYLDKKELVFKEGMNLWFYGDSQTQKTSVAIFILKYFIYSRYTAYYISYENLVRHLEKIRFNKDGDSTLLSTCDLLVIDNVPANIPENSSSNLLAGFLINRIEHNKPNIYINMGSLSTFLCPTFLLIIFKKRIKEIHFEFSVNYNSKKISEFYNE